MNEKPLIGCIENFSDQPFIDAAEVLVRSDEPERALTVLNNLPAFFRDNVPVRVEQLRQEILRSLVTPHAYASVDMDCEVNPEVAPQWIEQLTRGRMVRDCVEKLNQFERQPHIIEIGPGEYWLPIGLYKRGYKFSYWDISLLQRSGREARKHIPDSYIRDVCPVSQPIIFIAFELIEHLMNPMELAIEAMRHGNRMPEFIFLSTPLYCFDGRAQKADWKKKEGMPHLRAYTPQEFLMEANRIFPLYSWEITMDSIMVLKGDKRT